MSLDLRIAIRRFRKGLPITLADRELIADLAERELARHTKRPAKRPLKLSRWHGRLEVIQVWLLRQLPATYPQIGHVLGFERKTRKTLDQFLLAQMVEAEKIVDLARLEAGAADHGTFAQVGLAFDALAKLPLKPDLHTALNSMRARWQEARAERERRDDAEELVL